MPGRDTILLIEAREQFTDVPHHKVKIALHLSALRHFAGELRARGFTVRHEPLAPDLLGLLHRHAATESEVIFTAPSDFADRERVAAFELAFAGKVEIRADDRFVCPPGWFARWAEGRKEWRLEYFYREMRRLTGLLMEEGAPAGGRWNFDAENRARLPAGVAAPPIPRVAPDAITAEILALVEREFPAHPGTLDGFAWPVTRAEALLALDDFIKNRLPRFGDYQDAMQKGERTLFHSLLAPLLNIGLLTAREVCAAAEAAWRAGHVPLNAAEGFIRQVIGWREYVRELYHHTMPGYRETNALGATRPLPAFYWHGRTDLACLSEVITDTLETGYAHHIQRLVITGNFALLAGINPAEVEDWYLAVYADAFDWVELPNTHGMALYADGGRMASKPYAASAAYISRMSDYCTSCVYDPKLATGPKACPFNALYWDFLMRNRDRLGRNPRLAMPYRNLDRFTPERRADLQQAARRFLEKLDAPAAPAPKQLSLL